MAIVSSLFLELLRVVLMLFQLTILLEYSYCLPTLLLLCLYFLIPVKDNFVPYVFSPLASLIKRYKRFRTKLVRLILGTYFKPSFATWSH